jgi:AcrR family transcriptional regulator
VPSRRLSADERREQLLDHAAALAAGGDVAALSVRDIAAAAGVSEGLLYHYFPTKAALLVAVVQRAADAMTRALDRALQGPPLEALMAGLAAYLDHVQADPTGWRVLLEARSGELAVVAQTVVEHSRRLTLDRLGAPEPSAALAAALDGWTALETAVCLHWLASPQLSRAAVEDLLLSSFLSCLQAAARHDDQSRAVLARLSPG